MAMLQIGPVAFKISGPHYDSLKHSARFMWPAHGRFGRRDALQSTGEGEETLEVSGTIYPDYFPGFPSLARLRSIARKPQMVVSGAGDVMGRWAIEDVSNEQTYQDRYGRPAKVTFTVRLKRYGEDGAGLGLRIW